VADRASKEAQQVATTAVDQGQQVARGAARQAREVADTSREQVAQVAQELSDQARYLLDETKAQLQDQAQAQSERLAEALHRLGEEAQALAEGRADDAPTLRDYVRKAADKLEEIADDLESESAEGLLEDVQTLARRRPGLYLVGAGAAGLVVGRLVRNAGNYDSRPSPGARGASSTTPTPRRWS
jgi:gas vesicle protein